MKENQAFQYRFLNWALLTDCAVLALSANRQNFSDYFSCRGGYGVGFPVSFLCDYGSGGSPINGWGRIDLSDFPFFSLQGLVADLFFYFAILLCVAWLIRAVVYRTDVHPLGHNQWMILLSIAFIVGSLFSLIAIRAQPHKLSRLYSWHSTHCNLIPSHHDSISNSTRNSTRRSYANRNNKPVITMKLCKNVDTFRRSLLYLYSEA